MKLNVIQLDQILYLECLFSPIYCLYEYYSDPNFIKFKQDCSKTGTTESIAVAEKLGFKTDLLAINPLDQKIKVPVYFANFVLMDGLGAVFGCPA